MQVPRLWREAMEKARFVNLRVYRLSEQVADTVWEIVLRWNPTARRTVGEQLIRASDSIGANIAEGAGRGTRLDSRKFVRIARGSLYETSHWLRRAFKRRLLSETDSTVLKGLMDNLSPQLNAFLNSFGKRAKGS
jgi:four helix bundle protein